MAVIEDPRTTATRLEKALAMDQALTAKVLRIANSPFYGAAREIKTVSEAIVRLGFVDDPQLDPGHGGTLGVPGAGRRHALPEDLAAVGAVGDGRPAGRRRPSAACEPESVFIGGLMQNIGQLVLARSHPELFQEILVPSRPRRGKPYHEVERQLLGFDHGELGALLISEWNLTEDLEEAVRWHHRLRPARGAQRHGSRR